VLKGALADRLVFDSFILDKLSELLKLRKYLRMEWGASAYSIAML